MNPAQTSQAGRAGAAAFVDEVAALWRQQPDKGMFLVLLGAWTTLFHFFGNSTFGYTQTPSLFGWMHFVFTSSPDDEHGLYVPLAVLGLLYWKRKELMAVTKAGWWPALGLVVLALLMHLLGYLLQQTRLSIVAFFVGLYGLTGLVWGRRWLAATFFPMFLFAFCVPLGTLAETLTFPLRLLVTNLSVAVTSGVLGIDVIRDGVQIFDAQRTYQYEVAAACSGIRSLVALLALTTIYGFVTFQSPWKRLLMVGVAAPLAVIGNTVRLTAVIVVAEAFGQKAGLFIETKFGFVTFAIAIVCVLLLGHWLREPKSAPAPELEARPV